MCLFALLLFSLGLPAGMLGWWQTAPRERQCFGQGRESEQFPSRRFLLKMTLFILEFEFKQGYS